MLVVMKNNATTEQVQVVIAEIEKMGYRGHPHARRRADSRLHRGQ